MLLFPALFLVLFWSLEGIGYLVWIPDPSQAPIPPQRFAKLRGTILADAAYLLSLMRAPLGIIPYLVKVWLQLGLKLRYEARRTSYQREVLNMLAEIVNLVLTWLLVRLVVDPIHLSWLTLLCYLPLWSECVRLLAERLPILFSTGWQLLPHRQIALFLLRYPALLNANSIPKRYCCYYTLSDIDRAATVLAALKQRASLDPDVSARLAYLQAFRIVSPQQALRGGFVRDVARGEVFIHAVWTNDPSLLVGMALRRSPWSFDPRYQSRPFYYMSGANRVMSLFVLRNAQYSWPYALFQFGHEIRVARLHFFYVLLRWLNVDIERKVWVDGTFQNDQCLYWLKKHLGRDVGLPELRPLYNDEEVIAELLPTTSMTPLPSAQEIAEQYIYPLTYVEEVLLYKLSQAQEKFQHEHYPAHSLTNPA